MYKWTDHIYQYIISIIYARVRVLVIIHDPSSSPDLGPAQLVAFNFSSVLSPLVSYLTLAMTSPISPLLLAETRGALLPSERERPRVAVCGAAGAFACFANAIPTTVWNGSDIASVKDVARISRAVIAAITHIIGAGCVDASLGGTIRISCARI